MRGKIVTRTNSSTKKDPERSRASDIPTSKVDIFNTVRRKRAFEEVSAEVKRLIFKGLLRPGDQLPSENELASRLGVGRQTMREAIRYLELSGFITTKKGAKGGAVITDTVLDSISNLLLDAFQMKKATVHDFIVARLEIEKAILKQVLIHIDDENIKLLRNNTLLARKKIENRQLAFHENVEFHKLLAKASKNYIFVVLEETIMTLMADFLSRRQSNLRFSSRVVKMHEDIFKAIVKKNDSEAFTLLEKHLLEVEESLKGFSERSNTIREESDAY